MSFINVALLVKSVLELVRLHRHVSNGAWRTLASNMSGSIGLPIWRNCVHTYVRMLSCYSSWCTGMTWRGGCSLPQRNPFVVPLSQVLYTLAARFWSIEIIIKLSFSRPVSRWNLHMSAVSAVTLYHLERTLILGFWPVLFVLWAVCEKSLLTCQATLPICNAYIPKREGSYLYSVFLTTKGLAWFFDQPHLLKRHCVKKIPCSWCIHSICICLFEPAVPPQTFGNRQSWSWTTKSPVLYDFQNIQFCQLALTLIWRHTCCRQPFFTFASKILIVKTPSARL